jgi:RNA polymerase sigma factor (sigma-70 family)
MDEPRRSDRSPERVEERTTRDCGGAEGHISGGDLVARIAEIRRSVVRRNARVGSPLGPSDVDDVVQEVLARVWDSRGTYRGLGTVDAWIGRFCELAFLDDLRRRRLRAVALVDPDAVAARHVDAVDERIDLRTVVLWLPKREANIVARRVGGDDSFREIGRDIGLSPSAAMAAYERALARLRGTVDGRAQRHRCNEWSTARMSRIAIAPDGSVDAVDSDEHAGRHSGR